MAIITDNSYKLWWIFRNKHVNTIYKFFNSKFKGNYKRQRIYTADNDFLDLDLASVNSKSAVLAIHGLEGSSNSAYILSLTHYLNSQNIDVIAVNLRGCSGVDNNNLYSYHSGFTTDINLVVNYIIKNYNYRYISIVGYSLGANLALKYLADYAKTIPDIINCCVTVSAPCSLADSATQLAKKTNLIYMKSFLRMLKKKAKLKFKRFPDNNLDKNKILKAKNFTDFDNAFTAPVFGFKSAKDYWQKNSCKQFLHLIKLPTLLITALDDPFYSEESYPFNEAKNHKYFNFMPVKYGGHVGFNSCFNKQKNLWSEKQIVKFINRHTKR